jgi:hypothetical protein
MKRVGVKFMLTHGNYFVGEMTETEAKQLITLFANGGLGEFVSSSLNSPATWSLRSSEIVGLHTFDIAEMRKAQEAQQKQGGGKFPNYGGSGYTP